MPTTNRPFFANFFAAFRAHTVLQKTSPSSLNTSASTTTAASAAAYSSLARTYHTSSSPESSSSTQVFPKAPHTPQSTHSTSPHSAVATAPPQSHFRNSRPLHPPNGTPQSRGRIRSTSREKVYGPPSQAQSQSTEPHTHSSSSRTPSPGSSGIPTPSNGLPRGRRGSDSSSHSSGSSTAKAVLGASPPPSSMAEKWYIGGRTAQGEERFYKLGLVSSARSADRLSLDRLSL